MTTDNRPSITQLQADVNETGAEHRILDAAPVLLEITAAALAWDKADDSMSSEVSDDEVLVLRRALREVLRKVRS